MRVALMAKHWSTTSHSLSCCQPAEHYLLRTSSQGFTVRQRMKQRVLAWISLSVMSQAIAIPILTSKAFAESITQANTAQNSIEFLPFHTIPQDRGGTSREDDYTLGAGDQVRIDVFDIPELSGTTYTILVDGSLNLPWIGKTSVHGLTVEQAAALLSQRYARFVRDPLITISLLAPRPVRIAIVGEVNRPGAYITGQTAGGTITSEANTTQIRTVTQAIQAAGGITQLADVRNIQIRRPRIDNREEVLRVDLWEFLNRGELNQDRTLRDGDTLIIPTISAIDAAEATRLAAANFSPQSISVNVVGEVKQPGTLSLPSNVSLNQAILAAGGFDRSRARVDRVQLIRINPDGTATRQAIEVDLSAGVNAETNPPLRNNDIVVVGRSGLASTGDFLNTLLGPLNPLVGIFSILRLFGGF